MPAPTGQPIDRQALERVLARAAELQARNADLSESMSEADLLQLGAEVGLSGEHLKLALAEERTRAMAPADAGVAARLLGTATVTASRTVTGAPADVLAKLDQWFNREESLTVQRRAPTRLVWEPRQDFFGSMQRAFQLGGRGYALGRASQVAATAVALEGGRTHVRLDANLVGLRRERVYGALGTASSGVVASAILSVLHVLPPLWLLPAVVAPVAAVMVARSFREPVARAQVMLEHYLDRLEHGEPKAGGSLLDLLSPPRAGR
ncbi:MAG: hypothetical protein HY275_08550 [Gemmatimonadetes bacterium]|nr:hypothetical protein [Gemmatimonadota bacterium]